MRANRRKFLVPGLVAAAVLAVGGCAPSNLTADYRLQNTFSSSVGSPPDLRPTGNVICTQQFQDAMVDGVRRAVYCFPQGAGLAVRGTPTVSATVYSMAVLFRFSTVSGYRRVLDVKLGTSDGGLYVRDGHLSFYPVAEGAKAVIGANSWVQVVLTRDSTKQLTGYVDGVQQFRVTDTGDGGVLSYDPERDLDELRWFVDNTFGGGTGEESGGAVARIRLWNRALTADEVSGLARLS